MVSTRHASPETLLSLVILRRRTTLVTGRFAVVGTKAGRGGSPCLPPSQRIATTAADRAIVTPVTKVPTVGMSWNVTPPSMLISSTPLSKALLEIEVIPKRYLRRLGALAQKDA
jgi:hypothetical protein